MPEKRSSINLLRSQEPKFLDKFLRWALTVGRFLVIVTETTALLMFLYRFDIDRQLIDLHDLIEDKQAIVTQLEGNEASFRNLQERLSLAKKSITEPQKTIELFKYLYTANIPNVSLTTLTVGESELLIDVSTPTRSALADFVAHVRKHPSIVSVSITRVENKTSTATLAISIAGSLEAEQKKGDVPDANETLP